MNSFEGDTAPMRMRHPAVRLLVAAALVIAFIWPAIANRQPFFYPDTITYSREGDAVGAKLLHHKSTWSASAESGSSTATVNVRARTEADAGKRGVLAGRSMFYGIFVFLGYVTSHYWVTALMQAGCVLLAVWLTMRAFGLAVWKQWVTVALVLLLCSTAPFTSSLLMPDVFAGLMILGASVLLTSGRPLQRLDQVGWLVLLCAAALFHDTCLALAVVALVTGGGWILCFHRERLPRLGFLAAAVAAGLLGHAVFSKLVTKTTGVPPLKSPFLMARLIADGPGTRFLQATCPGSGFVVCAYASRMPMSSDQFLFNAPEEGGVFWAVPMEQRRALENEQMRFAVATLKYDPSGTLKSMLGNAWHQLIDFQLAEYVYPPGSTYHEGFTKNLPLPVLATMRTTPAYKGTFPWHALSIWVYVWVVVALLLVLVNVARLRNPLSACAIAILLGVVANAAICGIMSGVYPRFESRVIWLLPLMAVLLWQSRSEGSEA